MAGSGQNAKWPLLIINVFFILGGLVLIVLGAVIATRVHNQFLVLSPGKVDGATASYVLLGTALVMIVIGVVGHCSVITASRKFTILYVVILLPIFICLVTGAVYAGLYRTHLQDEFKTDMLKSMDKYKDDVNSPTKDAWDFIQNTWDCCGVAPGEGKEPWKEWEKHNISTSLTMKYPTSCCMLEMNCNKQGTTDTSKGVKTMDCYLQIRSLLHDVLLGIMITAIILVGLVFCCMGLAIWFYFSLNG